MVMEITEFDEQVHDKEDALALLDKKYREYLRGVETMGVVAGYEGAARNVGATTEEVESLLATADRERGKSGTPKVAFQRALEFETGEAKGLIMPVVVRGEA